MRDDAWGAYVKTRQKPLVHPLVGTGLVAAGVVAAGAAAGIAINTLRGGNDNQPKPVLEFVQRMPDGDRLPTERATVFYTGEIFVNPELVSIRETPKLVEKANPGAKNKISLSDDDEIDGVKMKAIRARGGFRTRNAKMAEDGDDVDGDGRGKMWIEIEGIRDGKPFTGYISRSQQTEKDKAVIVETVGRFERIVRANASNDRRATLLPSGGFNVMTPPATSDLSFGK